MVRESPSDYNTRLTVLETKMDEIVKDVNKLETTVSENYSTLHSRIDVLKDDIHSSIFDSHTKLMDRLDLQSKNSSMQHDTINTKILSGPAKNSTISIYYRKVTGGTLVEINIHLKLSLQAKILSPLIKKWYKRLLTGILYRMNNAALVLQHNSEPKSG